MRTRFFMPVLLAALIALTSCNKKMGELSADLFKVTPSPLEVIGGEVPATIDGKFPAKYFNKKAIVTVTPYLVYEGGEVAGESATFQGEKVQNNYPVIAQATGGSFTMKANFKYTPEMRKSELFLAFKIVDGKKEFNLPRVKVADGVISTAEIASAESTTPAIAADKFQRIIKENHQANIMFLIQQATIRSNQLKGTEMKSFNESLKAAASAANKEIENIMISSYASPDGGMELNEKLAKNRENATLKEVNKQLKKDKVKTSVEGQFTAEDWAGFQELVEKSSIQDKELILRVLSMYSDPEQREREIKNMSSTFKVLAEEILPQLRYSRLTATVNVIGKSDEELTKFAKENAAALSVDELLFAATLEKDNNGKAAIYTTTTNNYPSDYRAFNNLGVLNFQAGKVAEAKSYFDKAAQLAPSAPEVQMNLGLVAIVENNYPQAEQSFGKSSGVQELGAAQGVLHLKKGEYAKSVKAFGDTKSNNAGLAQLLTGDYSKAKSTLAAVEQPNATTYYLLAVVGARTNNENMVKENLDKSKQLDPAMAKQAATDIEFAKFSAAK